MNEKCKGAGCNFNIGIKCDVENCLYHTTENHCRKDKVNIGNRNAVCEEETVCSSFEKCR